jgi:23S rRNA (uracil1939-C5)-methyltransferase
LETVAQLDFKVGPSCFFQPNPKQSENLLRSIREFAREGKQNGILYDLYCGVGSIGLFLSNLFESVLGVENHSESISFARENARRNGISNCRFIRADALDVLRTENFQTYGFPDTLILDPPRAGLHPKLVKRIMEIRPKQVIYSSCNPSTQARDLKEICGSYEITGIQPLDMFPQTYHFENIISLEYRA